MAELPQCRVCNLNLPRCKFRKGTTTCIACSQVWDRLNGEDDMRYSTPSRAEFFGTLDRLARIRLYAARAELMLPLFDGVTTED